MNTRTLKIMSWIISGLLAAIFVVSGLAKLIGSELQIKNLESWGYPIWLRFPLGLLEIAFAIGLWLPKYKKLTNYVIINWAVGAAITHWHVGQMSKIGFPVFIGALAFIYLIILEDNRRRKIVKLNT